MKKSKFTGLVLAVLGILFFGLGMCMCMIPEWDMYKYGIAVSAAGFVILLLAVVIYRRMEQKTPVQVTLRTIFTILIVLAGCLGLGTGMSLTMVFGKFVLGIVIGIAGIAVLLSLIPLCRGLH